MDFRTLLVHLFNFTCIFFFTNGNVWYLCPLTFTVFPFKFWQRIRNQVCLLICWYVFPIFSLKSVFLFFYFFRFLFRPSSLTCSVLFIFSYGMFFCVSAYALKLFWPFTIGWIIKILSSFSIFFFFYFQFHVFSFNLSF